MNIQLQLELSELDSVTAFPRLTIKPYVFCMEHDYYTCALCRRRRRQQQQASTALYIVYTYIDGDGCWFGSLSRCGVLIVSIFEPGYSVDWDCFFHMENNRVLFGGFNSCWFIVGSAAASVVCVCVLALETMPVREWNNRLTKSTNQEYERMNAAAKVKWGILYDKSTQITAAVV